MDISLLRYFGVFVKKMLFVAMVLGFGVFAQSDGEYMICGGFWNTNLSTCQPAGWLTPMFIYI
jgi:hypothetical protein